MPRTSTWSSLAVLGPVRRCALLLRGSMLCAWCGVTLTYDTAQIDHVHRREHGGSDAADNLVGCCPACNLDRPARRHRGLAALLRAPLDLRAGRELALLWYPWLPARDRAKAEARRRRRELAIAAGLGGTAFPFGACA
jgi:5-methylcytosine-specific restriction endonuclease McrA